jgi:hypothetical protein
MKGLNGRWTRGVSHEAKARQNVYHTVLGARGAWELLREILDEVSSEVNKAQSTEPDYHDAAWAYRQAHLNGKKEMLATVKDLIPSAETLKDLEKQLTEN